MHNRHGGWPTYFEVGGDSTILGGILNCLVVDQVRVAINLK